MRQAVGKIASISVYENRVNSEFLDDYTNILHSLTDNQARKMDGLLIRDSGGNIVKELKSALIEDYAVIKAKKEMRLKNRKDGNAAPKPDVAPKTQKNNRDNRLFTCTICHEIKNINEFWTYGGQENENMGKCKSCQSLVTENYNNTELPDEFNN